jgi:hypothetical protein
MVKKIISKKIVKKIILKITLIYFQISGRNNDIFSAGLDKTVAN